MKRSNEGQSSLKMTRSYVDRMVYRYADTKELNNADRCMLRDNVIMEEAGITVVVSGHV